MPMHYSINYAYNILPHIYALCLKMGSWSNRVVFVLKHATYFAMHSQYIYISGLSLSISIAPGVQCLQYEIYMNTELYGLVMGGWHEAEKDMWFHSLNNPSIRACTC